MIKVRVYRNLRKKCWSIQDAKTKKVIMHLNMFALGNCHFKVSKAGQERVRREKQKNVHAFVDGFLLSEAALIKAIEQKDQQVTYNPYENDTFVIRDTQKPVDDFYTMLLFTDKGVFTTR